MQQHYIDGVFECSLTLIQLSASFAVPAAVDAAVKARVSGARLRKFRQSETVALAAVHQKAVSCDAAHPSVSMALQVLPTCSS